MGKTRRVRTTVPPDLKGVDVGLHVLGLERIQVAKDGSCLFRAVAQQYFGTQEKHLALRTKCAEYIKMHQEDFQGFVDQPLDHYLASLQHSTYWGGEPEIVALHRMFRRDIIIYREEGTKVVPKKYTEWSQKSSSKEKDSKDAIRLVYMGSEHYDAVVQREWKKDAALCQSIVTDLLYSRVLQTPTPPPYIVDKTLDSGGRAGEKFPREVLQMLSPKRYRNIAQDLYDNRKQAQEDEDRSIAVAMHNSAPSTGDTKEESLSGSSQHQQQQQQQPQHHQTQSGKRQAKSKPQPQPHSQSTQQQQPQLKRQASPSPRWQEGRSHAGSNRAPQRGGPDKAPTSSSGGGHSSSGGGSRYPQDSRTRSVGTGQNTGHASSTRSPRYQQQHSGPNRTSTTHVNNSSNSDGGTESSGWKSSKTAASTVSGGVGQPPPSTATVGVVSQQRAGSTANHSSVPSSFSRRSQSRREEDRTPNRSAHSDSTSTTTSSEILEAGVDLDQGSSGSQPSLSGNGSRGGHGTATTITTAHQQRGKSGGGGGPKTQPSNTAARQATSVRKSGKTTTTDTATTSSGGGPKYTTSSGPREDVPVNTASASAGPSYENRKRRSPTSQSPGSAPSASSLGTAPSQSNTGGGGGGREERRVDAAFPRQQQQATSVTAHPLSLSSSSTSSLCEPSPPPSAASSTNNIHFPSESWPTAHRQGGGKRAEARNPAHFASSSDPPPPPSANLEGSSESGSDESHCGHFTAVEALLPSPPLSDFYDGKFGSHEKFFASYGEKCFNVYCQSRPTAREMFDTISPPCEWPDIIPGDDSMDSTTLEPTLVGLLPKAPAHLAHSQVVGPHDTDSTSSGRSSSSGGSGAVVVGLPGPLDGSTGASVQQPAHHPNNPRQEGVATQLAVVLNHHHHQDRGWEQQGKAATQPSPSQDLTVVVPGSTLIPSPPTSTSTTTATAPAASVESSPSVVTSEDLEKKEEGESESPEEGEPQKEEEEEEEWQEGSGEAVEGGEEKPLTQSEGPFRPAMLPRYPHHVPPHAQPGPVIPSFYPVPPHMVPQGSHIPLPPHHGSVFQPLYPPPPAHHHWPPHYVMSPQGNFPYHHHPFAGHMMMRPPPMQAPPPAVGVAGGSGGDDDTEDVPFPLQSSSPPHPSVLPPLLPPACPSPLVGIEDGDVCCSPVALSPSPLPVSTTGESSSTDYLPSGLHGNTGPTSHQLDPDDCTITTEEEEEESQHASERVGHDDVGVDRRHGSNSDASPTTTTTTTGSESEVQTTTAEQKPLSSSSSASHRQQQYKQQQLRSSGGGRLQETKQRIEGNSKPKTNPAAKSSPRKQQQNSATTATTATAAAAITRPQHPPPVMAKLKFVEPASTHQGEHPGGSTTGPHPYPDHYHPYSNGVGGGEAGPTDQQSEEDLSPGSQQRSDIDCLLSQYNMSRDYLHIHSYSYGKTLPS